ncbi:MAG: extracellular solute-binding protein [Clostridia bacterium]|nr:extracellular solute-binding protein [Clostridia bacterium]
MRKTKFQRVTSLLLALILLTCGATVTVAAQDAEASVVYNPSVTDKTIADYKEELESISYDDYSLEFKGYDKATNTIVIDAIEDLDEERTTLDRLTDAEWAELVADKSKATSLVGIYETEYEGVKALYTPGDGTVSFVAKGVTEGLYAVRIYYWPVEGKSASIEREFYINGGAAFKEARSLTIPKVWTNAYTAYEYKVPAKGDAASIESRAKELGLSVKNEAREDGTYLIFDIPEVWTSEAVAFLLDELEARFFTTDKDNNEIRPTAVQTPKWCVYDLMDSQGYYAENFEFILTPDADGNVYISLKGMNEPMAISKIELMPKKDLLTYDEYIAQYKDAPLGSSIIKLEAELPSNISTNTVYPAEDRSSAANSPADTTRVVLNTVGGEKWQTPGQAVEWRFQVGKTGLYTIDARFRQNVLDGLFVSRSISLYSDGLKETDKGYYNGYPFAEAAQVRFGYSGYWQSTSMMDGSLDAEGNMKEFQFYFVEGVTYTLKLEVTLGTMSSVVSEIEESLNRINDDYLNILRLTGTKPDDYRDYNFTRIMPQTLADMVKQSNRLQTIADELKEIAGSSSSTVGTLIKVSELLYRMHDEDEIARHLETLKSYIGSLGTFLTDAKKQPLQLDYLLIQSPDAELPTAEPGFFKKIGHEISSFIQSFLRDYNSMGAMEEVKGNALEVWVAYGRDQSQVIRNLVTNDFTASNGIPVDLKLVTGGTLLPSILAGMGPDVYLGIGHGEVINYAIRGALATLDVDSEGNVREDFEAVTQNFTEAAMLVLGIENADGEMHYYALPETQSFPMLFVRIDILASLDIDIPKTWNDIYEAQTVLEGNNMQIGLNQDYKMFLYQGGGELFADGGMRINLDSQEGLLAFETMCNLFTMHSFPYQYDAANRFRTGEMPILIADYTGMYNQLKVFATEIEGLWKFVPLPGIESEDGTINNSAISGVAADIMVKGSDMEDEAWEYLKWYTGADCQTSYANDMASILGDSAKHPTANKIALASMPWTTEEYTEVQRQFQKLASVPNYPGTYYIDRYTGFAFLDAYNEDADPTTELLSYINTINKEITRKRSEFALETLEIGQTKAEKRGEQAQKAFELLAEESDRYDAVIAMANIAIADEDIVILEECSATLMAMLASVDPATYNTIDVSRQDQMAKNGGYQIDSLDTNELIYFAAQCLADAAAALGTY